MSSTAPINNPAAGIGLVLLSIFAISINDAVIKALSGDYALHQMMFVRSAIGLCVSLVLVQLEGGWRILATARPGLHVLRALLVVLSNLCFFAALAVLPLGEATALFFAAPLFITLLSIPVLGERVGPLRLGAVVVGFLGVLLMQRPWGLAEVGVSRVVLLLPVLAAVTYALMQILTRKLGLTSKASALAVYNQGMFVLISSGFWLVAGDGRFAAGVENESLAFLLRGWTWPEAGHRGLFLLLGLNAGIIGYCLAAAYRIADAATVAPFEYVGLPLAVFWGWAVWGELPGAEVSAGIVLILGSGLFVFLRERQKKRVPPGRPGLRR